MPRATYAGSVSVILSDLTPAEAAEFVATATVRHPALPLTIQVRGDAVDVLAAEGDAETYPEIFAALVEQALPRRLRRARCEATLRAAIDAASLPAIGAGLEALVRHLEGGARCDGLEVAEVLRQASCVELRGRCWWLDRGDPEPFVATVRPEGGHLSTARIVLTW